MREAGSSGSQRSAKIEENVRQASIVEIHEEQLEVKDVKKDGFSP